MNNFDRKMNIPLDCGRKEDLVAYLYEDIGAGERVSFERHLEACEPCRIELKAFGRVRDDLNTWQVAFAPHTEIALPKSRLDKMRELIGIFPAWARGAALTAAAASLLLFAFSFANARAGFNTNALQTAMTPEKVDSLIKEAVAKERSQIQDEYRAQMAGLKDQLDSQHQLQMQALNAENQAKLEAMRAGLMTEIRKSNRQNSSIRSFFAMDDSQDPFGEVK